MLRPVYLTIDDAPSSCTHLKLALLAKLGVTVVFFCRGSFLCEYEEAAVSALRAGHLLGNHSFSHPYFSSLSFADCCQEIDKTEVLIDRCYARAGVKRSLRLFRFPFGDRGGKLEPQLQQYLREHNFSKPPQLLPQDSCVDLLWTIDSLDYKRSLLPSHIMAHVEQQLLGSHHDHEVIMLHDFPHSHAAFEKILHFLLTAGSRLGTILTSLPS